VQHLNDIVRCQAGRLCREISHKYLKNRFIDISEMTARDVLSENPRILDDVRDCLRQVLDCFQADYDPRPLIEFVSRRTSLTSSAQVVLCDAVEREYFRRFEPEARRGLVEHRARRFETAVSKWMQCIAGAGVGVRSAVCWSEVTKAARSLRDLLEDPSLAIRWIP